MAPILSFRYSILILISTFSMLILTGLSWHAPSVDLSEFYSTPPCWMAMEEMMVCGYKISAILGGNLGDGSMNIGAIGAKCCKAINDVSSKCAFEGVNPLDTIVPQYVKDLCFGNKKGDLFKPNYPFVDNPFGLSKKTTLLKDNHVSLPRFYRTLPTRS